MSGKIASWGLLFLLSAVQTEAFAAPAQVKGSQAQTNKAQYQSRRPAGASEEFKCERLTEQVDFPDVPRYTGKAVFLSGLRYPNDRYGQRVGMTLGVNESPDDVIQWYKETLKSYRWNLNDSGDPRVISAVKDGNTFSMRIAPTQTPGHKTLVVLSFQYGR